MTPEHIQAAVAAGMARVCGFDEARLEDMRQRMLNVGYVPWQADDECQEAAALFGLKYEPQPPAADFDPVLATFAVPEPEYPDERTGK